MRVFNRKVLFAAAAVMCLSGGTAAHASEINENTVYEESDTAEKGSEDGDSEVHRVAAIGSVSKVFCVTAAMQLAEQGKLNLDAPVTDYIKEFKMQDERYKDISSLKLLAAVAVLLKQHGFRVINIDVTVIAQAPKLLPYRKEMVENIAKTLGMSVLDVSVKATTEERLGFTGSGEGIAAHAVCLIDNL